MTEDVEIKPGDVVQISPFSNLVPCFHGVFCIVHKVKAWGLILVNYSPQPGLQNKPPGTYYLRVPFSEDASKPNFFRVGPAPIVPGDIAKDIWPDAEIRTRDIQEGEEE